MAANLNVHALVPCCADWNDYSTRARERVSISVPIVLPCTGYTKAAIDAAALKGKAERTTPCAIASMIRHGIHASQCFSMSNAHVLSCAVCLKGS
jgi:hypothetical protein